jgi:hypothetical protein
VGVEGGGEQERCKGHVLYGEVKQFVSALFAETGRKESKEQCEEQKSRVISVSLPAVPY